jgi:hypothetical protein
MASPASKSVRRAFSQPELPKEDVQNPAICLAKSVENGDEVFKAKNRAVYTFEIGTYTSLQLFT